MYLKYGWVLSIKNLNEMEKIKVTHCNYSYSSGAPCIHTNGVLHLCKHHLKKFQILQKLKSVYLYCTSAALLSSVPIIHH